MSDSHGSARFTASTALPKDVTADALFVPVFQGDDRLDDCPGLEDASDGELRRALSSGEFRAKIGETFPATLKGWSTHRVVFAGAGPREDLDTEHVRRIASTCGYDARRRSFSSVGVVARGLGPGILADGLSSAEFDSGTYKSDGEAGGRYPSSVEIVVPGG